MTMVESTSCDNDFETELPSMPLLTISSPETIDMCSKLPLCDDDIFICSYPKSGTTWMQHIVLSLLLFHKNNGMGYDHVSQYAPFYEIDPHWDKQEKNLISTIRQRHEELGRRVFNTHLRWNMLPSSFSNSHNHPEKSAAAKIIYIVRSPLDVCVSFYYHLSNQIEGGYDGSFDEFFNDWIQGDIAFGSWIDHVLSFAPAFASSNYKNSDKNGRREVLLISYEEMLTQLDQVVQRLVEFLNLGSHITPEQIQNDLLPTFQFQHMKANLNKFQPQSVTWKNNFQFLRKGLVGDSKTLVTTQQRQIFHQQLSDKNYESTIQRLFSQEQNNNHDRKETSNGDTFHILPNYRETFLSLSII